jgi:hypothetical protein
MASMSYIAAVLSCEIIESMKEQNIFCIYMFL